MKRPECMLSNRDFVKEIAQEIKDTEQKMITIREKTLKELIEDPSKGAGMGLMLGLRPDASIYYRSD